MRRTAFLAVSILCCLSAVAYANPIISLPNWKILFTSGQSIDLNTGQPIAVKIETPGGPPEDQIQGVDLALSVNALTEADVTNLPGPLIEAVDLTGPGTVFFGNNSGQFDIFTLPARRALASTASGIPPFDVNAGDGAGGQAVLAYLSFDASGVAPGTYPIYLTMPISDTTIPTNVQPFFTPTLLDGSAGMFGMLTVITPEPGSIVLALFAAGGLLAVALRRLRRHCRQL